MNIIFMISIAKGLSLFVVFLLLLIGLSYAQQKKSAVDKIVETVGDTIKAVTKVLWHIKVNNDFRLILHRMGYVDEDIMVGKILKD